MASGVAPVINSVKFLKKKTFERLKLEEKIAIKQLGPDRPDINIIQPMVRKEKWLCGCSKKNTVFCFPCLLFGASV